MTRETLVFYSQFDPVEPWREAVRCVLPDLSVKAPDEIGPDEDVRYALVWKPPLGFFDAYPDLRLVTILGAGADALAGRTDLPPVPVARLSDPEMGRMMSHYVLFSVLRYARDIPAFEAAQRDQRWHYVHPREARDIRVGVLGLGQLGSVTAAELSRQGFAVSGWSRTPKTLPGVTTMSGTNSLLGFLAGCEILVIMLPLTPDTRELIDERELAHLPSGAKLINVSRGAIVNEQALVRALQTGQLGGATLNVFEREPLAPEHPLWRMPSVLVTPHLASVAIPASAGRQVAENIKRIRAGDAPHHIIDLQRGY